VVAGWCIMCEGGEGYVHDCTTNSLEEDRTARHRREQLTEGDGIPANNDKSTA
jgi:hypothetical protein